jgi:hypothetical protein
MIIPRIIPVFWHSSPSSPRVFLYFSASSSCGTSIPSCRKIVRRWSWVSCNTGMTTMVSEEKHLETCCSNDLWFYDDGFIVFCGRNHDCNILYPRWGHLPPLIGNHHPGTNTSWTQLRQGTSRVSEHGYEWNGKLNSKTKGWQFNSNDMADILAASS